MNVLFLGPFIRSRLPSHQFPRKTWTPRYVLFSMTALRPLLVLLTLPTLLLAEGEEKKSPPALHKGTGPGWKQLFEKDFANVNCKENTWTWKENGEVHCTGKPTGVIRSHEQITNFELVVEWKHLSKAGNSGVFAWATPESIKRLSAGQGRLPAGIEIQVLDLGYSEAYEKQYKKKADWFTCHGDVFPTGNARMKPFPPVAPNGKRSFPSKNVTKPFGHWNHYYIRALDGEVRLWVNGEEVSGGSACNPATGFLCLESEGAPIIFRNLRLKIHK